MIATAPTATAAAATAITRADGGTAARATALSAVCVLAAHPRELLCALVRITLSSIAPFIPGYFAWGSSSSRSNRQRGGTTAADWPCWQIRPETPVDIGEVRFLRRGSATAGCHSSCIHCTSTATTAAAAADSYSATRGCADRLTARATASLACWSHWSSSRHGKRRCK